MAAGFPEHGDFASVPRKHFGTRRQCDWDKVSVSRGCSISAPKKFSGQGAVRDMHVGVLAILQTSARFPECGDFVSVPRKHFGTRRQYDRDKFSGQGAVACR